MVGGTTPPQSDSGEISRVSVLNLLWQSKRCSRTAQDISVLTTPSLLSRGTPAIYKKVPTLSQKPRKGWAPRQKADSSPLKRIRNDKYLKAGSSRGAPRNDKYVKADSLRLNGKVPTLSQRTRKGWGTPAKSRFLTAEADSE